MNKRRRAGRGPILRAVLDRLSVRDKHYTYQRFKADQERAYHQSLTRVGSNYWDPEDEWSDG